MTMNPPISPTRRILTVTEDDDLDLDALLIDDSLSTSQQASAIAPVSSWSPRPSIPIKAIEEDIDSSAREWTLPPPSLPGDFLTSSLHRVPSKSILKKVSSYGNIDPNESISSSKRGGAMKSKSSYLSFDVSVNSGVDSASGASMGRSDYGLDLDSSSKSQMSTSFLGVAHNASTSFSPAAADTLEHKPKSLDGSSTSHADAAAGTLDTSLGSSKLSTSGKMRRNVSFSAVNVREYDRTVGDNPSCRSGPPLSLDWSYSKASVKSIDDFELQRSSERVKNPARLRVSKYTRRNMLAFHWGHSHEEMKQARSETKKLQRQRSMTQILLPVHMAHEVCISIKNMVSKKSKGLTRDEMSELSLSTSKHVESINNSSHRGSISSSNHIAGPPRVHAVEPSSVVADVQVRDDVDDA
ncbi:hypothetical protein ACHAXN_000425 [Cyclotella atomus]